MPSGEAVNKVIRTTLRQESRLGYKLVSGYGLGFWLEYGLGYGLGLWLGYWLEYGLGYGLGLFAIKCWDQVTDYMIRRIT